MSELTPQQAGEESAENFATLKAEHEKHEVAEASRAATVRVEKFIASSLRGEINAQIEAGSEPDPQFVTNAEIHEALAEKAAEVPFSLTTEPNVSDDERYAKEDARAAYNDNKEAYQDAALGDFKQVMGERASAELSFGQSQQRALEEQAQAEQPQAQEAVRPKQEV